MVTRIVSAAIIATTLLAAQGLARQPANYPHAFPRKGVTELIDNARVTVWEVNWRHGDEQPIHRHKYDMAGVYLRSGSSPSPT